jgi:hypothetical protein
MAAYIPQSSVVPIGSMAGTDMSGAVAIGRQVQGQNALAQAANGAVDPTTGQIDPNQLVANAAQSGNGLAIGQAADLAGKLTQNQQSAFNLHQQEINSVLNSVAAENDNADIGQTIKDIQDHFDRSAAAGAGYSPQLQATVINQATQADANGQLSGWRQKMRARALDAQGQINYRQGNISLQQNGPSLVPVATSGLGASGLPTVQVGTGSVPLGLTPGEAASLVQLKNTDGTVVNTNLANYNHGLPGNGGYTPPANNLAAATQPSSLNNVTPVSNNAVANLMSNATAGSGPDTPRVNLPPLPDSATNAAAQTAPVSPNQAMANRFGGVVGGTPLGAPEAAAASAQQYNDDAAKAKNINTTLQPLQKAVSLLNNTQTGQGAETINNVKGWLAAVEGPNSQVYNQVSNAQELKKYLIQGAQNRAAAFGPQTNENLTTTFGGSPNMGMTDMADGNVMKANISLIRADNALPLLANQLGVSPGNYVSWAAQQAQQLDPRAFGADYMTKAQVQAIPGYNANPPKIAPDSPYAKFRSSYTVAHQLGLTGNVGSQLGQQGQ